MTNTTFVATTTMFVATNTFLSQQKCYLWQLLPMIREGHRQSDEHYWNRFKGDVGKTFERRGTTSVEICGRGVLTVTRLMANGGALLNGVMCRVSKEPDITFLQVGGNDFPRTARNQRDADAFSLQLLELASPLNARYNYKAKRVVVGCSLPLPAVSCTVWMVT